MFFSKVTKKYFLNIDMESEEEFRPRYVQLLTDLLYSRCTDRFARLLANQERPRHLSAGLQPMRSLAAFKTKNLALFRQPDAFEIVSCSCMLAIFSYMFRIWFQISDYGMRIKMNIC
jgi:hypothetical protein